MAVVVKVELCCERFLSVDQDFNVKMSGTIDVWWLIEVGPRIDGLDQVCTVSIGCGLSIITDSEDSVS